MKTVLFLCTGNSARSIMAEAVLNHRGKGRFRAFSAGSHPRGEVHPLTLETLGRARIPLEGLRSKSWDEFSGPGAPVIDRVVTVCGHAASEECPYFEGAPARDHWGIDDPASVDGSVDERRRAFERALSEIDARVTDFLASHPEG
jgi:protein-tyrosine-phosphatase